MVSQTRAAEKAYLACQDLMYDRNENGSYRLYARAASDLKCYTDSSSGGPSKKVTAWPRFSEDIDNLEGARNGSAGISCTTFPFLNRKLQVSPYARNQRGILETQ
jgi:hypothetical protein